MYATSLPPRPNPHARVAENYAPRFSPDELPLLPVNWIPSWRSPPSKIWGEVDEKGGDAGATAAASSYASAALSAARPQTTGSIDSGLIPRHLLEGTVPPPEGKRASSLDYFPPCERPKTVPAINMGHQFRLLRDTPKKQLDAYKRGAVLRDGPVRIVRHTSKDRTYLKKSAHRNPRGISRNVLGGFCTS